MTAKIFIRNSKEMALVISYKILVNYMMCSFGLRYADDTMQNKLGKEKFYFVDI